MNKRQKNKRFKDCSMCKNFNEWDIFYGQYDNYGRCELKPYILPDCSKRECLDEETDLLRYDNASDCFMKNYNRPVCNYYIRKRK